MGALVVYNAHFYSVVFPQPLQLAEQCLARLKLAVGKIELGIILFHCMYL